MIHKLHRVLSEEDPDLLASTVTVTTGSSALPHSTAES
jgi:hypothetical protein